MKGYTLDDSSTSFPTVYTKAISSSRSVSSVIKPNLTHANASDEVPGKDTLKML